MNILHIGYLKKEVFGGVYVAVPQHIKAQQHFANVAFFNTAGDCIEGISQQFCAGNRFSLQALPQPFCHPDLVVFHNFYHPAYLPIAGQLRKENIPYVIVPHGAFVWDAQKQKWWKKIPANLLFFDRFAMGASGVQFLSQREADTSRFRKKGFIGTNGVFLPPVQKTFFHNEGIRLVYIGRTDVHTKGLDLLLEAVASKAEFLADHAVHLDLYGPDLFGRHAEILSLIRKLQLESLVSLHDGVLGQEKEDQLLDGDIFIQTSRHEGMPLGILEALSYGLPCIVTEGTGLGEIIRRYDAGWTAQTSAEAIAEALEQAVTSRHTWSEKALNARRLITENYLWEQVARDTIAAYRKICQKD